MVSFTPQVKRARVDFNTPKLTRKSSQDGKEKPKELELGIITEEEREISKKLSVLDP
jgi:hypothetical protein